MMMWFDMKILTSKIVFFCFERHNMAMNDSCSRPLGTFNFPLGEFRSEHQSLWDINLYSFDDFSPLWNSYETDERKKSLSTVSFLLLSVSCICPWPRIFTQAKFRSYIASKMDYIKKPRIFMLLFWVSLFLSWNRKK
jgi:hypothetical protein